MMHRDPHSTRRAFAPALVLLATCVPTGAQTATVLPTVETDPTAETGDSADDMVFWVHPAAPELSLVIGTDKQSGLAVYDLAGKQLQFLPDGRLNNVDIRYGFSLGPFQVAL